MRPAQVVHRLVAVAVAVALIVVQLGPVAPVRAHAEEPGPVFKRGDANGDGRLDLSDAIRTLGWLFLGEAAPPCQDAADGNDDGRLDISDPIRLLGYLFLGEPAPPAPGVGRPGPDPTADLLTCLQGLEGTPPTITGLRPAHGTVVHDARPTLAGTFSDEASGIDVASVRVTLDGADLTVQAAITPSALTVQPATDLGDGAHTLTLAVADQLGNPAAAATTFQVLLNPAPVLPQSGFIHGLVLHAETDQPLVDATITLRGVAGQALSGLDGRYQFPTPGAGTFLLTAAKAGFTTCQREIAVEAGRDTALGPAFLMPLDPQVTVITPEVGGMATDSRGEVQVEFPPGAVSEPIEVRLTPIHEEQDLPGPLPPDVPPVFMAVDVKPNVIDFAKAVTVRFPNALGLPPGTEIGFGFWQPAAYQWEDLGLGTVTADGLSVEIDVRHFCTICGSCAVIPPPLAEAPRERAATPLAARGRDAGRACPVPVGSSVLPASGDLIVDHTLPALRTLGQSRTLTLRYRSTTADPSALIGTDYVLDDVGQPGLPGGPPGVPPTLVPATTTATLQVEGQRVQATFLGTAGATRQAFFWDGRNARGERVPTGAYRYTVELSNDYEAARLAANGFFGGPALDRNGDGRVDENDAVPGTDPVPVALTTVVEGRVILENAQASPVGAGWSVVGVHRLTANPDGSVLVTEGDGTAGLFTLEEGGAFQAPPGDFSTLRRHADGAFTRTLKDGTRLAFTAAGRHTQTVDRNGNATAYGYDAAGRLTAVAFPGGATFALSYDGAGRLAAITDAAGRTTRVVVDGSGDLRQLTNPDETTRTFTYDAEHRLLSQTDERDFTTDYAYDAFGRLAETRRPPRPVVDPATGAVTVEREVRQLTAAETQGLINTLPPDTGTPEQPAPAIVPPSATVEDPSGHVTQLQADPAGGLTRVVDPLGRVTTIARDAHGLPTRLTRPDGSWTTLTYDGRGNLRTSVEESLVDQEQTAFTTAFTYEPTFNQVTSLTNPRGFRTELAYDAQGNLRTITDALGVLTPDPLDGRTTFTYDARGLLLTVTDALGNLTTEVPDDHETRFTYDPVTGNLLTTTDPRRDEACPEGCTTTLTYDAFGNVTTSTDAAAQATTFSYDRLNRLTAVEDAARGRTGYAYDPAGNLTRVTDANSHPTTFAYDGVHQLTAVTNPVGQIRQFLYDPAGNLGQTLDPKGQVIRFLYDAADQLLEKRLLPGTPDETVVRYRYDLVGNLTTVLHPSGPLRLATDLHGRLVRAVAPGSGGPDVSLIATGSFGFTVLRGTGEGTFQPLDPVFTGLDATPIAVAVGDLDADGVEDLVVSHRAAFVSLFFGNGDGTFQGRQRLPVGSDPGDVALADLNADSALDLVAANDLSADVSLLLGRGDGTFGPEQRVGVGPRPRAVAVGDLNGDGAPDLVVTTTDAANVSLLLGGGDGTFQHAQGVAVGGLLFGLGLTDLNADGRLDVVTANHTTNELAVLLGRGDGTVAPPVRVPVGDGPVGLALGDVTGDGVPDAVTANATSGDVSILLGRGDGSFAPEHRVPVGPGPGALRLVELTGEGALDLVVSRAVGGQSVDVELVVLRGQGDGTFGVPQPVGRYGLGGVLRTTRAFTGSAYDQNGNRTQLVTAEKDHLTFRYDALDRLTQVVLVHPPGLGGAVPGPEPLATFTYDALSRRTQLALLPGRLDEAPVAGAEAVSTYDAASQLLSVVHRLTREPARVLAEASYTYDGLGNRTTRTDLDGPHSFGYDALSRLTAVEHPAATGLGPEQFTYDPVGNRTSSHHSAGHRYDAANRLLEEDDFTYSYDANGNLTTKTARGTSAVTTFTYDPEDQLIQVVVPSPVEGEGGSLNAPSPWEGEGEGEGAALRTITFRYDGLGRRIEKTVNGQVTRWVYDNEDIVAALDAAGTIQRQWVQGPGIDDPLLFLRDANGDGIVASNERWGYHADGLGSIVALTNSSGEVVERYRYDSFGQPTILGPGPDGQMDTADDVALTCSAHGNPFLFTGREYDCETGLHFYRARYYVPRTGRFLQEDFFPPSLEAPETLHAYTYAFNDPVRFVDPQGDSAVPFLVGGAIVLVGAVVGGVVGGLEARRSGEAIAVGVQRGSLQGGVGAVFGVFVAAGTKSPVLTGAAASAMGDFAGQAFDIAVLGRSFSPGQLALQTVLGAALGPFVKVAVPLRGPAPNLFRARQLVELLRPNTLRLFQRTGLSGVLKALANAFCAPRDSGGGL